MILWDEYEKADTGRIWLALKEQLFSDKFIFWPHDIWFLFLFHLYILSDPPPIYLALYQDGFLSWSNKRIFKNKRKYRNEDSF